MKQKKAGYSLEFKLQAIQLVKESGQPIAEIARSLGVPKSTLFDWVCQHEKDHEEEKGKRSRVSGEVMRLKRELAQVKKERYLLGPPSAITPVKQVEVLCAFGRPGSWGGR